MGTRKGTAVRNKRGGMREIWIDGYNLIRQSERLSTQEQKGGLAAGRDALIRLLAAYRTATGDRVTVVFDGDDGHQPGTSRPQGIGVIFSQPPASADDVIVNCIQGRHGKKAMWVVSSDRAILNAARRHKITGMRTDTFETELFRKISEGRTTGRPKGAPDAPLSTEEVAHWETIFRTEKGMFED